MTEKRLLAVLGFLLALIGGILVIVGALQFGRNQSITVDLVAQRLVDVILGIAAILGGVFIYKGRMSMGGLLTIIIGVLIFILQAGSLLESILVIIGGVLGIVGSEARATS